MICVKDELKERQEKLLVSPRTWSEATWCGVITKKPFPWGRFLYVNNNRLKNKIQSRTPKKAEVFFYFLTFLNNYTNIKRTLYHVKSSFH